MTILFTTAGSVSVLPKIIERITYTRQGRNVVMVVGPPNSHGSRDLTYTPSRIHLDEGDELRWVLAGGGYFTIDFVDNDSPFVKTHFDQTDGPAEVQAGKSRPQPYKYNLTSVNGYKPNAYGCPEIIVQR